jgi:hypothetical protein
MIQEKFISKEEAIERAKQLAKTEKYISVILSNGYYYVENETQIIRIWEKLIWRFPND